MNKAQNWWTWLLNLIDFIKRSFEQYKKERSKAEYEEASKWGRQEKAEETTEYIFKIQEHPITGHFYPAVEVQTTHALDKYLWQRPSVISKFHIISLNTEQGYKFITKHDHVDDKGCIPCKDMEEAKNIISIFKERILGVGIKNNDLETVSFVGHHGSIWMGWR